MCGSEPLRSSGSLPMIDWTRGPRHIGCIPDGNGRWAEARGLSRTAGQAEGERATCKLVLAAADLGLDWMTLYAFSTENWVRPQHEVQSVMAVVEHLLRSEVDELQAHGIRIRFIGRRQPNIPGSLSQAMDEVSTATAGNDGMTLTFAVDYGGQAELVDAMRRIAADGVPSAEIDEDVIRRHLYDASMPDPDLIIRTSGEYRLSNFLLWRSAYSELAFTSVLWPDFTIDHLVAAIQDYQGRHRRFGGLDEEPPSVVVPGPP